MPSTFPCPKCGEYHYHKSHSKNKWEHLRKRLLNQRVYRCHMCGYRGWEKKRSISRTMTPRTIVTYVLVGIVASFIGYLCQYLVQ